MCWQAAILDQKISPPSTAVKMFFQFLEDATTLEHQDWALERHMLLALDSCARGLQASGFLAAGARAPEMGARASLLLQHFTFSKISSSLMSLICLEFSLRPENKANTKTH
jgi:hypothetical protein